MTSVINCLTSFLAGFVIFSVLGYLAVKQGKNIENVAKEGLLHLNDFCSFGKTANILRTIDSFSVMYEVCDQNKSRQEPITTVET